MDTFILPIYMMGIILVGQSCFANTLLVVNRSEMPGVHACTKGIRMIIGKELFPMETSTSAGEATLSLRDTQE